MKTTDTRLLHKLGLLFTFFLCSLAAIAIPVVTQAADAVQHEYLVSDDSAPSLMIAGEVTAGAPQAVLQLHKDLYKPQLQASVQPQYAKYYLSEPIPAFCNFFTCESALHSILTKGP